MTYYAGDSQFQAKLLACILFDPDTVKAYRAAIRSEYFMNEIDQYVLSVFLENYDKYKTILDSISLRKETLENCPTGFSHTYLDDRFTELTQINITDKDYLKGKIVEFGQQRAIEEALEDSIDLVHEGMHEKVEKVVNRAFRVGSDERTEGCNYTSDIDSRFTLYENSASSGQEKENAFTTIPTGLDTVDRKLDGGLSKGEFGIILAPPNRGKTTILVNFGVNALKNGYRVAHYTLELSVPKIARRYDMCITGKDKYALSRGGKSAIKKFFSERPEAGLRIMSAHAITPMGLMAKLERLKSEEFDYDLVIVDYPGLMEADKPSGNDYKDYGDIMKKLYHMTQILDVGMWGAWQVNREGWSDDVKIIGMEHVADCAKVDHHVDHVISVNSDMRERENNRATLFGAKTRDSASEWMVQVETRWDIATVREVENVR